MRDAFSGARRGSWKGVSMRKLKCTDVGMALENSKILTALIVFFQRWEWKLRNRSARGAEVVDCSKPNIVDGV